MNRFVLIFIALIFTGCATFENAGKSTSVEEALPLIGVEKKVTVGDEFFEYSIYSGVDNGSGRLFEGQSFRFDLTITKIAENIIELQYSEYTKPMNPYGGFIPSDAWLIKQGFNKTFTYSPKETIRFKGYEFEPITVSNGQITYKRVK